MSFQKIRVPGPDGQPVEGDLIPVNAASETAATYLLADGTTLSMRTVVLQVVRIPGRYDAEGNPVYITRSQNIVLAQSPDSLRRKAGGPEAGED